MTFALILQAFLLSIACSAFLLLALAKRRAGWHLIGCASTLRLAHILCILFGFEGFTNVFGVLVAALVACGAVVLVLEEASCEAEGDHRGG